MKPRNGRKSRARNYSVGNGFGLPDARNGHGDLVIHMVYNGVQLKELCKHHTANDVSSCNRCIVVELLREPNQRSLFFFFPDGDGRMHAKSNHATDILRIPANKGKREKVSTNVAAAKVATPCHPNVAS